MSVLNTLKLVTSKQAKSTNPVVAKRTKLCEKIEQQIKLCEAHAAGQIYAPTRLKSVVDEAGNRTVIETAKRVSPWYWAADGGKFNLAIRYGAKTLPLAKGGKNAIEIGTQAELVNVLQTIKAAVIAGELDDAIAEVSKATSKSFAK